MAAVRESLNDLPEGGLVSFLTSNLDEIEDNVLAFGRPGGINSMSEIANRMARMGRNGDNYIVHASEKEVLVPREVAEKNPEMMQAIRRGIAAEGADPDAYVVGSESNSINPYTGQREFFLKSLVKGVKNIVKGVAKVFKKVAPVVLPFALNAMFPGLGTIASGALGAGIGTLVQGGSFKDALKSAVLGGAIGGLTSGIQGAMSGEGFMAGVKSGLPSFGGQAPELTATLSSKTAPDLATGELGGTAGEYVAPTAAAPAAAAPAAGAGAPAAGAGAGAPAAATAASAIPETPGFFESVKAGNFGEAFFPKAPSAVDVLRSSGITNPLAATPAQMEAAKMIAAEAAPSLIRQYAPIAAAGTLAMGALGGFETPTVEGPGAFRGPTTGEIEARKIAAPPPTRPVYAADVMAQPSAVYQNYQLPIQTAAQGGEMKYFPRRNGYISGPGTETSDDIPAMLSDGEFVMTAKAVRGAGGGDRQNGVRKMYQLMRAFEGGAV